MAHSAPGIGVNSLLAIADKVLSLGFAVAFTVLLARFLGPESMGLYAFNIALFSIISALTNFGIQALLNREVARSRAKLSRYLGNAIAIRLFISFPLTLIVALLLGQILGWEASDTYVAALSATYVQGLMNILMLSSAFVAIHDVYRSLKVNVVYKTLSLGSVVPALYFGAGLESVLAVLCLSSVAGFLYGFHCVRLVEPKIKVKLERRFARVFLITSIPLSFGAVSEGISLKADSVLLGTLASQKDVGYYAAAYNVYLAVIMMPLTVTKVFFAKFVGLYEKSRVDAFKLLKRMTVLFALYSCLATIMFWAYGQQLIRLLFGESFAPAVPALMVLAIAIPAIVLNRLFNHVLVAWRDYTYVMYLAAGGAAANVVLNLGLIPMYGIVGAAVATACTEYGLLVVSWRRMGGSGRRH